MSWTTNLFLRLSPLILPYLVLFCGGVFLTVCQSIGVLTPLPQDGGALDAYARLLTDRSFFASFAFSLGVAAVSALFAVAVGTISGLSGLAAPRAVGPLPPWSTRSP